MQRNASRRTTTSPAHAPLRPRDAAPGSSQRRFGLLRSPDCRAIKQLNVSVSRRRRLGHPPVGRRPPTRSWRGGDCALARPARPFRRGCPVSRDDRLNIRGARAGRHRPSLSGQRRALSGRGFAASLVQGGGNRKGRRLGNRQRRRDHRRAGSPAGTSHSSDARTARRRARRRRRPRECEGQDLRERGAGRRANRDRSPCGLPAGAMFAAFGGGPNGSNAKSNMIPFVTRRHPRSSTPDPWEPGRRVAHRAVDPARCMAPVPRFGAVSSASRAVRPAFDARLTLVPIPSVRRLRCRASATHPQPTPYDILAPCPTVLLFAQQRC
jgi:hypothetical protein